MCWMAMLGSAAALRQGRHLGVRILVEHLPSGVYDKYLAPIIQLVMLAFFLLVTVKGWAFAMRGGHAGFSCASASMIYPYLCLPVGGALMALSMIADMLQDRFPTSAGSNASIASTVMEDISEVAATCENSQEAPVFDPSLRTATASRDLVMLMLIFLVFLVSLFLGVPVALCLAFTTVAGLMLHDTSLLVVVQRMFQGFNSSPFSPCPSSCSPAIS